MYAEHITNDLYRVRIPFEDLTTTVYIANCKEGTVIIDSATYPSDVDDYVLPALAELGVSAERVCALALTHNHGDHGGGLARLAELFPTAAVRALEPLSLSRYTPLADGEMLAGDLQTVHLPGHTSHSVGYLDRRTKTLLSGDCLQLGGIGKYRNGIKYPTFYLESIEKLRAMDIGRIVAAHEFDPLGSLAEGSEAVARYLNECAAIAHAIDKRA